MAGRPTVTFLGFGEAESRADDLTSTEEVYSMLERAGVKTLPKDLENMKKRFGIHARWDAGGQSSTDLSLNACRRAIVAARRNDSHFSPEKIRLIMHGTSTPARTYAGAACILQDRLRIPGDACEVHEESAACNSWMAALMSAYRIMLVEKWPYALVVAGETIYSSNKIIDRNLPLWGDGAGAVVLKYHEEAPEKVGILGCRMVVDGSLADLIVSSGSGTEARADEKYGVDMGDRGPMVQVFCERKVPEVIGAFLKEKGLDVTHRTHLVPHNANLNMVNRIAAKIITPMYPNGIPASQVRTMLHNRGNTAAASIPITLCNYRRLFHSGDVLILVGFGAGMQVSVMLYGCP